MNDVNVNAVKGVRGFYRMQVLTKDREIKHDTGWFPNLITDRGLDYLCSLGTELGGRPQVMLNRCTVGTGSATPAPTDLALAGTILGTVVVASATGAGVWVNTPEYYVRRQNTYEFALGAVVGNVAEVGIGPSTTSTAPYDPLFSRALVRDSGGTPTTITILADEILRVFYEIQCYCDMASDETYVVNISGVDYTITQRPANLGGDNYRQFGPWFVNSTGGSFTEVAYAYSTDVLSAKTTAPSTTGGSLAINTVAANVYTLGDHYRDLNLVLGTTQANFAGGIGIVTFGSVWGKWQCRFSPKIPKTNLQILTLNFRQTYVRI